MKKRILYILLGVMLLSNVGMGQINSLNLNTPEICNGDNTAYLTINSSTNYWIFVEYKDPNNPLSTWTIINPFNQRFRVLSGVPKDFLFLNFYQTLQYRINYSNNQLDPLSSGTTYLADQPILTVNPNTSITTQPSGFIVCAGGSSTALSVVATGTGTITYQWYSNTTNTNSGGTLIGSATNASYTPSVTNAGIYYYYVEATSSCSSEISNAVTVTVKPRPTATITSTNSTICNGDYVILDMSVTAFGNWTITVNDGIMPQSFTGNGSGARSFNFGQPNSNTAYSFVNAIDENCTSQSSDLPSIVNIAVRPQFTSGSIAATGETICYGGTPSVIGSLTNSSGGDNVITYSWRSSTDGYTAAITGATSSTYTPSTLTSTTSYRRYANDGVCNTTATVSTGTWTVTVRPQFTSGSIAATGETICYGGTPSVIGSLTNSSGGDNVITYSWRSSTDGYTAAITGATLSTYTPSTLTSTTSYRRYANDGVCNTTATASTGTWTVTVNSLPAKPTLTNQTICEGTTATITGPTGTYTYTWQVPTGVATSTTNSVITSKAGTYSLTITDANSCTSEIGSVIVTVNPLPAKPTLTSQTICEGLTATITGPTGTYTYTWQVPTGVTASTTNILNTAKVGTYSLTITDANTCSSEVGSATVTVNPLPAKPTLTSQTICEGLTATITGPTGTYTYTWQVPTGVTASTTNILNTAKAGTYSLTITDANTCSSEVGSATVTVNPLPAKPTLTSQTICEGLTATITGPTGTYTYTWQVPTGVTASTTNILSTTKAGTYSLTITDANNCTSEAGSGVVTVNALPTVTITNPSAVCAPGTVDLTASTITAGSTASLTYTYFTSATATSTLTNTTSIGSSGTYYIKGTTASNCSAVNPVIISINPVPTFNVTSPSVCIGSPLKVTANPLTGVITDYDYTWVVPTGVTNPGNVSNFTTTIAGVYAATIKNKTTNCVSAQVNNTVSFYPLPTAAAIVATDNKVVVDKTLNLTAAASGGSSPYSISWTPNPTNYYTISGQENAVFTALKEGKVKFKYQVKDANSCEVSSVEYEITIDPADIILVLPNAFTPNGDNNNDEFKVAASNTLGKTSFKSLEIYNRNGKLMFRTEDITQGWNGRYDNVLQDMGVYFVKLVKLNKDGQLVVETSPIYLLK